MPLLQASTVIACPPPVVFDFLARPVNFVRLSLPDLKFDLVQAPERLALGSVVIIKSRRWGGMQRLISSVIKFEEDHLIVDEQRHGPFRRFVRSQRIDINERGALLSDRIEFEPPTGFMGLMLTADRLGRDLERMNEFRTRALKKLLESPETP